MNEPIFIKVRCFSHVREALGKAEVTVSMPAGSTCSDLEGRIRDMAEGRLEGVSIRFAVNKSYRGTDVQLRNGDEVALIPPVQGG